MLLLQSISHHLETRREKGYSTSLRKIRAHAHIRGNDLADVTAKLIVTDYGTLPHEHTIRVEIGAIAPRHPFWVMYTATPPHAHTGPRHMAETSHPPPSMADNPESGPPPNARFHAPLISTATESQGCDPTKHAPYLHLHEANPTNKDPRGEYRYHRDSPPRPYPRKLKRGHKPPQIHPRTKIQWQTCQTLRTRPNGQVSFMPPPRLLHTHRRRV